MAAHIAAPLNYSTTPKLLLLNDRPPMPSSYSKFTTNSAATTQPTHPSARLSLLNYSATPKLLLLNDRTPRPSFYSKSTTNSAAATQPTPPSARVGRAARCFTTATRALPTIGGSRCACHTILCNACNPMLCYTTVTSPTIHKCCLPRLRRRCSVMGCTVHREHSTRSHPGAHTTARATPSPTSSTPHLHHSLAPHATMQCYGVYYTILLYYGHLHHS